MEQGPVELSLAFVRVPGPGLDEAYIGFDTFVYI